VQTAAAGPDLPLLPSMKAHSLGWVSPRCRAPKLIPELPRTMLLHYFSIFIFLAFALGAHLLHNSLERRFADHLRVFGEGRPDVSMHTAAS